MAADDQGGYAVERPLCRRYATSR